MEKTVMLLCHLCQEYKVGLPLTLSPCSLGSHHRGSLADTKMTKFEFKFLAHSKWINVCIVIITRDTVLCLRDWKEKHQHDHLRTSYTAWARFFGIQFPLSAVTSQTPCLSHTDGCQVSVLHTFSSPVELCFFLLPLPGKSSSPSTTFAWMIPLLQHPGSLPWPHALT